MTNYIWGEWGEGFVYIPFPPNNVFISAPFNNGHDDELTPCFEGMEAAQWVISSWNKEQMVSCIPQSLIPAKKKRERDCQRWYGWPFSNPSCCKRLQAQRDLIKWRWHGALSDSATLNAMLSLPSSLSSLAPLPSVFLRRIFQKAIQNQVKNKARIHEGCSASSHDDVVLQTQLVLQVHFSLPLSGCLSFFLSLFFLRNNGYCCSHDVSRKCFGVRIPTRPMGLRFHTQENLIHIEQL